ncbi:hypothetical protein [Nostoc sp.]|uniref:hypothetical protein n=1 Tax=Nostoc sp. TaxID=1180 RepID=UPI002FF4DB91
MDRCDSRSLMICQCPKLLTINVPVVVISETKNENIKGGLGQCAVAMLVAQLFNQQEGNEIRIIYGAVTTRDV